MMVFPSVGPPCQPIPNRYPGQAPGGLTSWADQVGFGQVSSLYFFPISILFLFLLFSILDSN
jgi:hypothetical protein